MVALYFCVRIGVRGDATQAPRGALDTSRAAIPKISLPFKKRKGVQGEAAKKLKGNFWFAHHYDLQKVSFKAPFRIEGFSFYFSSILWCPRRYAYTNRVVNLETLTHSSTSAQLAHSVRASCCGASVCEFGDFVVVCGIREIMRDKTCCI